MYRVLAGWLTVWENPRTRASHENALILKTFLFQFINCNAAIFYTTFIQADYSSAMMQIIGIVVSKQLIDFGKSLLVPMAFVHRRKRSLYNKIKLANEKALKKATNDVLMGKILGSKTILMPVVGWP